MAATRFAEGQLEKRSSYRLIDITASSAGSKVILLIIDRWRAAESEKSVEGTAVAFNYRTDSLI